MIYAMWRTCGEFQARAGRAGQADGLARDNPVYRSLALCYAGSTDSHLCPWHHMPRRRLTPEQVAAYMTPGTGCDTIGIPCRPADFVTEYVERGRHAQATVDEFIADYNKRHPIKPARTRRPKGRA
jgi:hypothetical protein